MKENVVMDKSIKFAPEIIKTGNILTRDRHEFVLSKQLLKVEQQSVHW
jgi:hypothetical protein